ncbi:MAG: hypothetical protein HMLKMBBP_02475 [Planctomycetes bacterium]|nr:hypothetical protein [Planctomycetota bacterium]
MTPAVSAPRTGAVAGLAFLAGRWRGEGTLRGAPVATRSTCEPFAETMLRMDVETFRDGELVHRERILWRPGRDGAHDGCTTSPWRGGAQEWVVETVEPGRAWRQTHPGFVWEIRRTDAGYEESFDRIDGAARDRIIELRHAREASP